MLLKVECEKKKLFEGVLLKANRPEVESGIFMANEAPDDNFDPSITVWLLREEESRNWITFNVSGAQTGRNEAEATLYGRVTKVMEC